MAKSRNKSNSTPRRKKYNRHARLQNAKKWSEQYTGKNIAKGYSNWFGVDIICAITELEMLGYKFKKSYKDWVHQSLIDKQKQKEIRERKNEEQIYEDGTFFYITGFTSNGFPYGITIEELENIDENIQKQMINQDQLQFPFDDEDLTF
jgi:hypothetical protein